MNLGKRIKSLRLQKSVTQEKLAEYLSISAQAVSKWENDITTPDIQLLPELSAYFGVTIDELFALADKTHIERIQNMLWTKRILSKEEYEYAENFLNEKLDDNTHSSNSLYLLAELKNHKAVVLMEQAEYYAKEALKENPASHMNHVALRWAQSGTYQDWNYTNHHKRIAYYQEFVKENPNYTRGYMALLLELIADGRLKEAESTLIQMKKVKNSCRVKYYEGLILWAKGEHAKAYSVWHDMVEQEPDNWLVYGYLADRYAADCKYHKSIEYHKKAFELQPSPKYVDAPICIAHIYEIMGEYEKAIESWKEVIRAREAEWNIIEGEGVDEPLREIERLKELM